MVLLYLDIHPEPFSKASIISALPAWLSTDLICCMFKFESPITFPLLRMRVTLEFAASPRLSAIASASSTEL